jgi:phenylacetate-CoA oxygenase PaaI subunit
MSDCSETVAATAHAALANLIVVVADNKYYLGRRLSEWTIKAPRLESGVACAAIAGEELGTARVMYPLLEQVPLRNRPVALARETDRERHYNVSFLDDELPTWSHVVAALTLVDSALNVILEAVAESAYEPLAARGRRILDEELFHTAYTTGRVHELAAGQRGREALQARIDELLPEMLLWFGPADEPGISALRQEGLIDAGNEELRERWLDRLGRLLEPFGIVVEIPTELPWERWNALQRRMERTPAAATP